jgi:hypothetical protein
MRSNALLDYNGVLNFNIGHFRIGAKLFLAMNQLFMSLNERITSKYGELMMKDYCLNAFKR